MIPDPQPKPKRLWLRFSLRTLLAFMHKIVPPLIGAAVSFFFIYRAATNMPDPLANDTRAKNTATTSEVDQAASESPHDERQRRGTDYFEKNFSRPCQIGARHFDQCGADIFRTARGVDEYRKKRK